MIAFLYSSGDLLPQRKGVNPISTTRRRLAMATSKNLYPFIDESKLLIKAAQTTMVLVFATLFLLPWTLICAGDYTKHSFTIVIGVVILVTYMVTVGIKAMTTMTIMTPLQKIGATIGGIISCPAWIAIKLVSWLFSLPI